MPEAMTKLAPVRPRTPRRRRFDTVRFIVKPAVFALCLAPLAWIAWAWSTGALGANPIEATTRTLGDWALRFLLVTLAITPLRRLFGWPAVMRLRRMLGLFTFFYVILHLMSYVVLDQFFDWAAIGADIVKRKYITVGMATLLLLLPLAITSTKGWIKRLGGAAWQRLHRLVYGAAILALIHYFWMVKADLRQPVLYAAILALLLGWRVVFAFARPAPVRQLPRITDP
jgi:sulfoxide reductase heme-binding subunit YedZ